MTDLLDSSFLMVLVGLLFMWLVLDRSVRLWGRLLVGVGVLAALTVAAWLAGRAS